MNKALRFANSPIFVVGPPRSGTTLLLSLLDSHPSLMVYPKETKFFDTIWPLYRKQPHKALTILAERSIVTPWYMDSLFDDEKAQEIFLERLLIWFEQLGGSAPALLQSLLLAYAEATHQNYKQAWVEKTPNHQRFINRIFQWFPNAKIIYIVRDPRATLASYRGHQKIIVGKESASVGRFCLNWMMSVRINEENSKRYPILTIRYEDLVCSPVETLANVCQFLNIALYETILHPTFGGKKFNGFSAYKAFDTDFQAIEKSSLTAWQSVLSEREVKLVNYLLVDDAARFGYDLNKNLAASEQFKFFINKIPCFGLQLLLRYFPHKIWEHIYTVKALFC